MLRWADVAADVDRTTDRDLAADDVRPLHASELTDPQPGLDSQEHDQPEDLSCDPKLRAEIAAELAKSAERWRATSAASEVKRA